MFFWSKCIFIYHPPEEVWIKQGEDLVNGRQTERKEDKLPIVSQVL